MTWTDPDHTDEEWVQSWEDDYDLLDPWAPEAWMEWCYFDYEGAYVDFFSPRPRWVSDRP